MRSATAEDAEDAEVNLVGSHQETVYAVEDDASLADCDCSGLHC
jgi:hypothetical protein